MSRLTRSWTFGMRLDCRSYAKAVQTVRHNTLQESLWFNEISSNKCNAVI